MRPSSEDRVDAVLLRSTPRDGLSRRVVRHEANRGGAILHINCVPVKERERHREREAQRERHTERDTERDRERQRETQRETQREVL